MNFIVKLISGNKKKLSKERYNEENKTILLETEQNLTKIILHMIKLLNNRTKKKQKKGYFISKSTATA